MPSSGSSKRGIYLGHCLNDLHRLSEVKPLGSSVNVIIKSSDKVFKDAEKFDSQGDEEKAFVMYMKYFNILKQVKARAEYKKQKEFFDNLIGRKNQVKAIERAEKLSDSLKQRYELKEAEAVAKKLDAQEEKKSLQKDNSANKTEKQEVKSEALETSVVSGSISCTQFCNLMRDSSTKLILMDVRPASDFAQSHVSHTECISVPEDILTPGSTVSHIESKLTDDSKVVWQNRKHVDHIIIIDWQSKYEDVKIRTPARTLRDALFKFDTSVILKSEPLILDGGYEQWLILYPTMTTNAHVTVPNEGTKIKPPSPTFNLNFDYPDSDDDAKKIDSQSSVSEINSSISSQNGLPPNSAPSVPKVDRSLKPSLSQSMVSANGSTKLNNADATIRDNSKVTESKSEEKASDLYPKIILGVKHQNGPSDKNVNVLNDAHSKNINLTVKNNLTSDVSESVQNRKKEEAELRQFQVSREGKLQENEERVNDLEKKLHELELMKKKEEKDVADLMRMKRKVTEELALEKKKQDEDKQRLATEEEEKISALQEAKQEEEEKKRRLAEVEQLRAQRRLEEQKEEARQKEEETRRREAEERDLQKQKEELAESERRELESLSAAEAKRQLEEEDAQRKIAEMEERKRREELELMAKKEEEERKAEDLRQQKEKEKSLEEERQKQIQRERELEELKHKQEERAASPAPEPKGSQSSPAKTATSSQLPAGWEKRLDKESNRYYYIDHNRGKTQWTAPTAAANSSKESGTSVTTTKLKEEPSMSSSRGLSRSHSSPNIMKQLADEEKARRALQIIDRTNKPNISSNRPIVKQTAYSMRKRDLNPIFGNVGGALTGLRNLGNTCYMNSTVQCLSNTSPLVTYFLNETFLDDINRESKKGMHGEVVDEFAVVIKALWSGQYRSITPRDLKSTIGKYSPLFAGYDQQDSQEFLTFLLDGLHEGLNEVKIAPNIPEQNNDHLSDEQAARLAWDHHKLLHRSVVVELFQGQLKSTLMCRTCNKTSTTFQTFMFLSLPIPKSSRCTLQNCIQEFLKPEMMTGSSRWKCTRCKVDRDSEKKIDIWRLPPILLIGLNRFYSEGMWMQKKTTYVDFAVSDLDMTPWTAGSSHRSRYSLYGISNHYGTMEGGHYTAFCRNPITTRWYKYDDQDVHEIHTSDIKTSAAFVLYYSSIPLKAPLYNPRL